MGRLVLVVMALGLLAAACDNKAEGTTGASPAAASTGAKAAPSGSADAKKPSGGGW